MRFRTIVGVFTAVLVAGLLPLPASAAQPASASHPEVIKLAFIDPLSGPFANAGESSLRHFRAAVETLNERVPLKNVRFEVTGFDNKTTVQDSLTHHPIGMYGISKTVVGYAASSLGVRLDVENPGSRLIMGFGFYLLHQGIYFAVARNLVNEDIPWAWGHTLGAALANGLLAVVLFAVLDKLKRRG